MMLYLTDPYTHCRVALDTLRCVSLVNNGPMGLKFIHLRYQISSNWIDESYRRARDTLTHKLLNELFDIDFSCWIERKRMLYSQSGLYSEHEAVEIKFHLSVEHII
jgi:hypothetical protein